MAQVSLVIHGKSYSIACDPGQEKRVQDLGRQVDARLREIAAAGAATTETHLMVLASLVMADEIQELRESVNGLNAQVRQPSKPSARQQQPERISVEEENEILSAIDHLAARIDTVAERLAKI